MSTTLPPAAPPANRPNSLADGNLATDRPGENLVVDRIEEAADALWRGELIRRALGGGLIVAGIWAFWVLIDHWCVELSPVGRGIAGASVLVTLGGVISRWIFPLFRQRVHPDYAARALERDHPQWRGALSSYWDLRDRERDASLDGRVIRNLGRSAARELAADPSLPAEATGTLKYWIATIVVLAVGLMYSLLGPKSVLQSTTRLALPLASIEAPRRVTITEVQPGNTAARAGRPVTFSARVRGLRNDETATCVIQVGASPETIEMSPTDQPEQFSAEFTLPVTAAGSVGYLIDAGDATSQRYVLEVEDLPVVTLQSVSITPPAYTGERPFVTRSGAITAIDGSRVNVRASVNRPVTKARLEFNPEMVGQTVRATAGAIDVAIDQDGTTLTADFKLRGNSRRKASVATEAYQIRVWDSTDTQNRSPIIYPIRIVEDLPPEISITIPRQSPRDVPIDAQQLIEVHASDPDFGLTEVSLEMNSGLRRIVPPTLFLDAKGRRGNQTMLYRFRPGDLDCRVGDIVQIRAIALDNREVAGDPTMQPNQTATDPIEFRIVAGAEVPDAEDPTADGLSKVDDQPATSAGQNGQGDQDGQAGGGGGSSSPSSGQQSGQGGQSGGGDSSSDGTPSEDGTPNESGENQESDGQGSRSESGNSGEGENSGMNQGDSRGDSSSDDSSNETAANESSDSTGESSSNETGSTPSGSPPNAGESSGAPSANANPASSGDPTSSGEPNPSGNQGASDHQGASGEQESSGAGSEPTAPQHDGEAFERIKDYLDQRGQDQRGQPQNPNQSAPPNKPTNGEPTKSNPDQGSDPQPSGSQDMGSQDAGSQDNGPQNAGSQNAGSPDSGSQDSGSQDSGSQDLGSPGDRSQDGDSPSGPSPTEDSSQGSPQDSRSPQEGLSDAGSQGDPSQSDNRESSSGETGNENENAGESDGEDSGSGDQAAGDSQNAQGPSDSSPPSDGPGDSDSPGDSDGPGDSAASRSSQPSNPSADPSTPSDTDGSDASSGQPPAPGTSPDATGSPNPDGDAGTPDDSGANSGASSVAPGASSAGSDNRDPGGSASAAEPNVPADVANEQYAKQATDLVLDYLDQNGDNPDPELLERLKWSADDLKRFRDRWQDIRGSGGSNDAGSSASLDEAIESLGLRRPTTTTQTESVVDDGLRGLRDSGSRTPPPPAYRDAFDAFRRSLGRSRSGTNPTNP